MPTDIGGLQIVRINDRDLAHARFCEMIDDGTSQGARSENENMPFLTSSDLPYLIATRCPFDIHTVDLQRHGPEYRGTRACPPRGMEDCRRTAWKQVRKASVRPPEDYDSMHPPAASPADRAEESG
jgi:hypothetical protein